MSLKLVVVLAHNYIRQRWIDPVWCVGLAGGGRCRSISILTFIVFFQQNREHHRSLPPQDWTRTGLCMTCLACLGDTNSFLFSDQDYVKSGLTTVKQGKKPAVAWRWFISWSALLRGISLSTVKGGLWIYVHRRVELTKPFKLKMRIKTSRPSTFSIHIYKTLSTWYKNKNKERISNGTLLIQYTFS